ncbi:MAG: hypothetical protein U1E05_25795, partial [Patescibacteria group bacterium]|nr:hypothetical protein [Patescibacteria group bacterium]
MSPTRLVLASLAHYWRAHVAVAAGVAVAAAVLTGALLVGDSMRGSLRHLVLDRLGRIDYLLLADRFFHEELSDELADAAGFYESFDAAVPAILLKASLENADADELARVNDVNLIGCDVRFWRLGHGTPAVLPGPRQITINRAAADALSVAVGDAILLRLPQPGDIPAESTLGRRHETVRTARLEVAAIVENEGLGRFGLEPTQHLPRNAYLPLDWLAERLDRPEQVNAILVAGGGKPSALPAGNATESAGGATESAGGTPESAADRLQSLLEPTLADFGLQLERAQRGYFQITSDRMVLTPRVEAALRPGMERLIAKGARVQPALTYLA